MLLIIKNYKTLKPKELWVNKDRSNKLYFCVSFPFFLFLLLLMLLLVLMVVVLLVFVVIVAKPKHPFIHFSEINNFSQTAFVVFLSLRKLFHPTQKTPFSLLSWKKELFHSLMLNDLFNNLTNLRASFHLNNLED